MRKKMTLIIAVLSFFFLLTACGSDPTDISDKQAEEMIENAVDNLEDELKESWGRDPKLRDNMTESYIYYDENSEKYYMKLIVDKGMSNEYYMEQIDEENYQKVYEDEEEAQIEEMTPIYEQGG